MDKEKFEALKLKAIEKLKNESDTEPKYPYALFGVECGDGWKRLYLPITKYIENYNNEHEDKKIEILQIKEKFGGLRYYCNFYTEELREMIDKAEEESFNVCEICGKHIDKPIIVNHWIYAECRECYEKCTQEMKNTFEKFSNKIKDNKEHCENSTN